MRSVFVLGFALPAACAFSVVQPAVVRPIHERSCFALTAETKDNASAAASGAEPSEAVFVPLSDTPEQQDDATFEKVEAFGRGSAKAKRGRRRGQARSASTAPAPKAALVPEEVFYEGPPAITETIAPTISILTVVGIIPAAAAWARQAWVRYKISNRRIRVQSGIGGNEMAEIIYSDIVEIRTARRLFGDGDLVAFLRDGARFEMRNIPDFEEAMEFILKQVDPEVAEVYRNKGEVTMN